MPDAGSIHGWLERLAVQYAEAPHRDEIAAAREDYFTRSGKVFEDDAELFEARVASFLEWYVIERPLAGGPPPAVRALETALADGASRDDIGALARIAASHRSLFHVAAASGSLVELEDVLGGARFSVVERRSTAGFEVGSLVEARLVWDGDGVVFARTFLFHPGDARDVALAVIDGALARGDARDEIMFHMCRMHVRWHRHGHVNAVRVYRGGG